MNKKKGPKHPVKRKNFQAEAKVKSIESGRWQYFTKLAIILVITYISFLPSLKNGFVWDDEFYIQKNALIHSINLKKIFSEYVVGNYHPLTILALALEYHFFRMHETGYHAINILLHLLNVVLVFYS